MAWRAVLLWSCGSALILAAAFPPLNLWPLGWLAPIGWLMLVRTPVLPRRSYWLIYLSGLLFWLTVLYGVGNAHWATRMGGWPALCSYLAVYLPLFVAISRTVVHRIKIPLPIAAPVIWTALEFVRAYFATGFSVAQLGHSQVDDVPLIQISEFTGAYGVSFVVMLVASMLAMCVPEYAINSSAKARSSRLAPVGWMLGCVVLLLAVHGVGYGLLYDGGSASNEADRSVRIGLVQGSIDTVFGDPTQSQRTFDQYVTLTDHLAQYQPDLDLIVWPETTMGDHLLFELGKNFAPPVDLPVTETRFRELIAQRHGEFEYLIGELGVRRWKAPLLLGTSVIRYGNKRVESYNSAIHVDRKGAIVNRYDKVHPVMFGEYVPFGDVFPFIYELMPIGSGLSCGEGPVAIDVDGVSLVPCICFENTVPQLVASHVRTLHSDGQSVDALVTLTNDGWFWGSSVLDLHLTCAKFRAVENRRPMLVAANTGISAVIDPYGRAVQQTPVRETTYLVAEVAPTKRPLSFYTRYGDWFAGSCFGLTIVAWGLAWIYRKRGETPSAEQ